MVHLKLFFLLFTNTLLSVSLSFSLFSTSSPKQHARYTNPRFLFSKYSRLCVNVLKFSRLRVNVLKFTLILFLGKYLSAVKYLDFAPHFREFRQNMEKICFKYIEGFFCFNSLVKIILCICCKFGFPRFLIFHSDK